MLPMIFFPVILSTYKEGRSKLKSQFFTTHTLIYDDILGKEKYLLFIYESTKKWILDKKINSVARILIYLCKKNKDKYIN